MSKNISLTDETYESIKRVKGTQSFSKFIEKLLNEKIENKNESVNDVIELKKRIDKIEEFVRLKSDGQYE